MGHTLGMQTRTFCDEQTRLRWLPAAAVPEAAVKLPGNSSQSVYHNAIPLLSCRAAAALLPGASGRHLCYSAACSGSPHHVAARAAVAALRAVVAALCSAAAATEDVVAAAF